MAPARLSRDCVAGSANGAACGDPRSLQRRARPSHGARSVLNLRAGIDTFRHWRRLAGTRAAYGVRVDRAARCAELGAMRPDIGRLLALVRRDGVAAVPGYWPPDACAAARAEIDRLIEAYPAAVQVDAAGADRRLFGVEAASALLARFHADPLLKGFGEVLGGLVLYNFATLGARIEATSGNTG